MEGDNSNLIVFSPAYHELNINAGKSSVFKLTITNNSNNTVQFRVEPRNILIDPLTENNLVLAPEDSIEQPAKWIAIKTQDITIPANSSREFEYTILPPTDASLTETFPALFHRRIVNNSTQEVGVQTDVLIPLFLNLNSSNDTVKTEISQLNVANTFTITPYNEITVAIKNVSDKAGFTHPRGRIIIYDGQGIRQQGTPTINDGYKRLLVDETVKETFDWKDAQENLLFPKFGKYRVVAEVYGNDVRLGNVVRAETSFWVIPIFHIVGVIVVGLLLVAAFIGWKRKKNIHKRVKN